MEGNKEENEDGTQLGSKSFLSVVIPRLETLLHSKKRKRSGSRDSEEEEGAEREHEEEGESPVKRMDTGMCTEERAFILKNGLGCFKLRLVTHTALSHFWSCSISEFQWQFFKPLIKLLQKYFALLPTAETGSTNTAISCYTAYKSSQSESKQPGTDEQQTLVYSFTSLCLN